MLSTEQHTYEKHDILTTVITIINNDGYFS